MLSLPDFKEKQIIFVILKFGEKLQFFNGNLVVRDLDGKIKLQASCYRLFSVFVVGSLTITDKLLQYARKFGFSIIFLSSSLKIYGSWNSGAEGNYVLRSKQYKYDADDISQFLVKNKISNQIRTLKQIRDKNSDMQNTISIAKEYLKKLGDD